MMIKMRTGKLEKHAKAVSGQFSHNAHAFAFACIPTPIRVGLWEVLWRHLVINIKEQEISYQKTSSSNQN